MRQIKFRAWDREENKWYEQVFEAYKGHVYELLLGLSGGIHERTLNHKYENVITHESLFPDKYALSQFTGIHDRNGTEIYEGDVVKCTDDSDEVNELNSDTGIGKVKWTAFGFWEVDELNNGLGDLCANGYVEIIGNIYENPELLEAAP